MTRNNKPGRDLHAAPGQYEHGSDFEVSTPARMRGVVTRKGDRHV